MNRVEATRVAALYIPFALAAIAGLLQTDRHRQLPACLLSVLWTFSSLLVLQCLNLWAGWWSFRDSDIVFRGTPLEFYLGWVALWGLLPQLAFPRLPIAASSAIMGSVDLIAMPACSAVIRLGPRWLVGEVVALLLVLLPALAIARWTREDTHLRERVILQMIVAGLTFLFLLPEAIFAMRPGAGWAHLVSTRGWIRQLALQAIALLALPGISAVLEFAERGGGSPIPYDPPKRLVTSGLYRYLSNPMQISCTLTMCAWAILLGNAWMGVAAAVALVYGVGIAAWDEEEDMERRFGPPWRQYRGVVRNWMPRWRPYHAGAPARLYIAETCGPCSELRAWIAARAPIGLELVPAESFPAGPIQRLRYDPADGSGDVDGVRAVARALEHLNLGWALAGAALRLPLVWRFVQVLTDAAGLGPRTLTAGARVPACCETSNGRR